MTNEDKGTIQGMLDAATQSITATITGVVADAISESEERMSAAIRESEERMSAAIRESEERSQEFARGIETRLLTAFNDYARGQVASVHRLQTSDADLAERISALESRVLRLETRPQL